MPTLSGALPEPQVPTERSPLRGQALVLPSVVAPRPLRKEQLPVVMPAQLLAMQRSPAVTTPPRSAPTPTLPVQARSHSVPVRKPPPASPWPSVITLPLPKAVQLRSAPAPRQWAPAHMPWAMTRMQWVRLQLPLVAATAQARADQQRDLTTPSPLGAMPLSPAQEPQTQMPSPSAEVPLPAMRQRLAQHKP
ncbi:hypothetical protein SAMN05216350_10958 [Polaromonas sp. YR568]|nr:hypothetical protein SAMN05216350_10958 [Polaromonas sp. YR568]